jgi:hypothetical protein
VPTIGEIQAAGGWIIEDPAEWHAASPETFWLPDDELRRSIRPGSRVQLIFWLLDEDDDGEAFPQGERMWLLVTRFDESRGTGLLASRPVSALAPLELGQTLQFRADDTIDVLGPEDGWEDERDALQAVFEGDEAFERWRDSKSES